MKSSIPIHTFTNNIPSGYLLNVEKVEFSNPYEKIRPHRHEYYELFVFDDMIGDHFVDFEHFKIVPKSIHLLMPHQVHCIERTSGTGWVMMFKKELLNESKAQHKLLWEPPFINNDQRLFTAVLENKEFDSVWNLCNTISAEFLSANQYNKEVIQTLLEALLLKIKSCSITSHPVETQSSILVSKFLILLDQHFIQKQAPRDYSEMLHISVAGLNTAIYKVLGSTGSQIIYNKLILESKRLLASTNWSAKEISFHLNFKDPAYFNRFFKKHTTVNPGVFRKTQQ